MAGYKYPCPDYNKLIKPPQLPFLRNPDFNKVSNIYDFTAFDLNGVAVRLDKYKGKLIIIVNVASKAGGFTGFNYSVLDAVYRELAESENFAILAFPCNQFCNQEPGSNQEIQEFIKRKGVQFDVFGKIDVNGETAHPLWKYLKLEMKRKIKKSNPLIKERDKRLLMVIKSPFTKFLINRKGVPFAVLPPQADRDEILSVLAPHFISAEGRRLWEEMKRLEESKLKPIQLPPPLPEDKRTCKKPWRFTRGKDDYIQGAPFLIYD